jgi:hypothetical protein
MKKYINVKNPTKNVTHIKIELYYNKGGYNCFTHREEKRGYYISVCPVARDGFLESYCCFTGSKQLIKEVQRKSEKAYNSALASINEFLPGLIDYVCKENTIEVENNEKIFI